MTRPVSLLTDYGPGTEHVGALHAVIAAACPDADRVDLAHDVPPGDVRWGALMLARLVPLLPGAVTVAVVDPGVGTDRAAIAIELADGGAAVGPDNGLLSGLFHMAVRAARLTEPQTASATFHGRDVFAPAAACLAAGSGLEDIGTPTELARLITPKWSTATAQPGHIDTTVIGRDRFGNIALDGDAEHLSAARFTHGDRVTIAGAVGVHQATVARTFADVAPTRLLLYVDSGGLLSLAERDGDAQSRLGLQVGAKLSLTA